MDVVDAQVHVWRAQHARQPWDPELGRVFGVDANESAEIDDVVRAMDAVGVDAAVLATLLVDPEYPILAARRHPDRFRVSAQLDLRTDPLAQLEAYAGDPSVAAIRIAAWGEQAAPFARLHGRVYDRLCRRLQQERLVLMLAVANDVRPVAELARAHPSLPVVVDHLGLRIVVRGTVASSCAAAFSRLDEVLELAPLDNVAVKLTAIPTVSDCRYPYPDLWPYLDRVLDAFGASRVIWGSNFTCVDGHTYRELLDYIRESGALGDDEREQILGGSLRRILGWARR